MLIEQGLTDHFMTINRKNLLTQLKVFSLFSKEVISNLKNSRKKLVLPQKLFLDLLHKNYIKNLGSLRSIRETVLRANVIQLKVLIKVSRNSRNKLLLFRLYRMLGSVMERKRKLNKRRKWNIRASSSHHRQ